ncbi:head-tail connector protein [Sphingomonas hankookensis]
MTALTLDLIKRYLRYELDGIDNDVPLSIALAAGIGWVEGYTGRKITGTDPNAVPPGLLHGVLLYAGVFDALRTGDATNSLEPAKLVCDPYRVVTV